MEDWYWHFFIARADNNGFWYNKAGYRLLVFIPSSHFPTLVSYQKYLKKKPDLSGFFYCLSQKEDQIINMASPYVRNLYFSFLAVSYAFIIKSKPPKAQAIISKVDSG